MATRIRSKFVKRIVLFIGLVLLPLSMDNTRAAAAQDAASSIRVSVVLVQLSVAVTDRKGNYVSGLHPDDFVIMEDGIPEKTATFEEGNAPARSLIGKGT